MGVERAVTRWYVQRQSILNEIALLEDVERVEAEATLQPSLEEPAEVGQMREGPGEASKNEPVDTLSKLAKAQEKLRLLGPCPKPMMG